MNDVYFEAFNNQTFNQNTNESAILRKNFYNPPNLIFQHSPVKEKNEKKEVKRMRIGCIIDTLTSVEFCKNVKMLGKKIEIYGCVIY